VENECDRLESEAQILDDLYKEASKIIIQNRGLLQPAEEPQEVGSHHYKNKIQKITARH